VHHIFPSYQRLKTLLHSSVYIAVQKNAELCRIVQKSALTKPLTP
jgi:hypothetical protein